MRYAKECSRKPRSSWRSYKDGPFTVTPDSIRFPPVIAGLPAHLTHNAPMLDSYFIAAGAVIMLALGLVHLIYTFKTSKFDPRDAALKLRMQEVSPVITRETTMWRTWIGFNASHSFGAILFGWLYGYFALVHRDFFFNSPVLLITGVVLLAGYIVLGRLYWFSIPFRGIVTATVLYGLGLIVHFA